MFASGHHSMMGSEEDPKDGGKVATAVFGAVVVYAVSQEYFEDGQGHIQDKKLTALVLGRSSSFSAAARRSCTSDKADEAR